MAWNDPEKRDEARKKQQWGRGEEGPPALDQALGQLWRKMTSWFGSKNPKPKINNVTMLGMWTILTIMLLAYVVAGIYVVQSGYKAVILRFGRYVRMEGPGPHWSAPWIESRYISNDKEEKVMQVKAVTQDRQIYMLTKDENLVTIDEVAIHYKISDPRDYLFNVVEPEETLQQVAQSALRAIVGQSTLDEVLSSGLEEIGFKIRERIQNDLDHYQIGIEISDVVMHHPQVPDSVKEAFDDALRAFQDEERAVNDALTYANQVIPLAKGEAARITEEARGYKEQVILQAQGKTAQFNQVLTEYKKAPQIMRERLFLDTMQQVYSNTPKVLIDGNGSNMVYLPIDKLLTETAAKQPGVVLDEASQPVNQSAKPDDAANKTGRPTYEEAEERLTREGEN